MKKVLGITAIALTLIHCSSNNATNSDTTSSFTLYGSSTAAQSLFRTSLPSPMEGATVYPGSPTELTMQIYAIWISANTDCSSPVLVQDYGSTPVSKDMVANPVLFTGSPASGTYQCLIIKIRDTFSFKPDTTAESNVPGGVCEAGVAHEMDIYRDGEPDDGQWTDLDGIAIDGTGSMTTAGNDTVYIFASTDSTAVTTRYPAIALSSALVVPGATTFYITFEDQFSVAWQGGDCWVEAPTMGFK